MNRQLKNVYHPSLKARADVQITDGVFAQIVKPGQLPDTAGEAIDCNGYTLLPALVDAHGHLDKTILGMDWFENDEEFDIENCIRRERRLRRELGLDTCTQVCRYIDLLLGLGVRYMRSHVDVDTENGLSGLEGVLKAREAYAGKFGAQLVAFPQSGLLRLPGSIELMDAALSMGADVVGGLDPCAIDGDRETSLRAVFHLAEKHQKPIDIHLHEAAQIGFDTILQIADRTKAASMEHRVVVSHAFCLSGDEAQMAPILDKMASAGIGVVTAADPGAPLVSVRTLAAHGVAVYGGNDNVRDLWGPFGSGDMLERAQLIAMKNGFRRDADLAWAFALCSSENARLLALDHYGIEEGCKAEGMLVRARNLAECVAAVPKERKVL